MQIKNIKKLYYSIGDVSQMTGLKQYVLRYWETEFSILNPAKNRAGNRTYKDEDIKIIRHIKELLYAKKFTIRGAKQYLEEYYSNKSEGTSNVVAISSQNVDREFLLDLKKKLQETINMIDKLKA
ncbi:MAG: transcriptional regulator [Candidatus Marinimicrobia bacterium]|nr:transcriptional regulator [Candidatus Neomarinimicrobiota bacterium]|tara:strand:- start:379 stop:753 length:375 start_codon:yes stop_codon:yes gene_type:complete